VKVTTEESEVPRIPYTPAALRDRFRAAALEAWWAFRAQFKKISNFLKCPAQKT